MYPFKLAVINSLTATQKRQLFYALRSAETILKASDEQLLGTGLINETVLSRLRKEQKERDFEKEYNRYCQMGYGIVTLEDPQYPNLLSEIPDPPYALFYKGTLPDPAEKLIACVGARRCSAYGRTAAEELSRYLADHGFSIVSGMALGIDAAAHRGALCAAGKTYAFLACGLDICYPRTNKNLYLDIPNHGALFSEFPLGVEPVARYFPSRNRLISGISQSVLVMEARLRSGSLITADQALEQGRDVYALPGRISDVMSEGCNHLIAQGAGIIQSRERLLCDLTDLPQTITKRGIDTQFNELHLEKEELLVYSCFDFYAKSVDEVQQEVGLDFLTLLSIILKLCEKGYLKEVFMNQYIRVAQIFH